MRKRLLYSYLAVILLAILGTSIAFCSLGYRYLQKENFRRFTEEVNLLKETLTDQDMTNQEYLNKFVKEMDDLIGARISIINEKGYIIADSEQKTKDDHSGRKEVKSAMEGKVGEDVRKSATTGVSFYYTATKIKNHGNTYVIRMAMPEKDVNQLVYQLVLSVFVVSLVSFALAFALGQFFIRKITEPVYEIAEHAEQIADGNYEVQIATVGTGHIYLLSKSLHRMVENLKENQKVLKEQNEELIRLEEQRAQFVSNVTHELKTPLTSILGFVDTLKEGAIHDEKVALRFLDIIAIEADRLTRLINDVLSLSEIEQQAGNERHSCDVVEVTREVEDILRMKKKKKEQELEEAGKNGPNVEFTVECDENIPEYPCDGAHLKELLLNLTDNALKYTKQGSVILRVFYWNDTLHIQVKDTGIGIEKEHLPKLFDRFYRVDKGRSRKQGGTGLGLSIVKHIVDLYGGTIDVESNFGYGTIFKVYFPYEKKKEK